MIHLYEMSDVRTVSLNLVSHNDGLFEALVKALPLHLSDHSMLNEYSRCPREATAKYGANKVFGEPGRSLAMEAGTAFHEAAAAVRLLQLIEQKLHHHADAAGLRIFGEARYDEFHKMRILESDNAALLYILNSGDFYDDPRDNRRTLTNLEECVLAYADNALTRRYPVWVADKYDSTAPIGIEQHFIIEVKFVFNDFNEQTFYFGGKMDGIHEYKDFVIPHENKTGSRIDDAWSAGMVMSHQVTGYAVAGSLLTGREVKHVQAIGVQVPLPRAVATGIRFESLIRHPFRIQQWIKWLLHNAQLRVHYGTSALNAPEATHACNKYFKACHYMPLCDSTSEHEFNDQESGMEVSRWNPWSDA